MAATATMLNLSLRVVKGSWAVSASTARVASLKNLAVSAAAYPSPTIARSMQQDGSPLRRIYLYVKPLSGTGRMRMSVGSTGWVSEAVTFPLMSKRVTLKLVLSCCAKYGVATSTYH